MKRRFQFSMRLLLLLPFLIATILAIGFPKLSTGDFCELTIQEVRAEGTGDATIIFKSRLSSGTGISVRSKMSSTTLSGNQHIRQFPTWSRRGTTVIKIHIAPEWLPSDASDLKQLLFVQQGQTYKVIPGQPLDVCRFRDPTGNFNEVVFSVTRGNRLGL